MQYTIFILLLIFLRYMYDGIVIAVPKKFVYPKSATIFQYSIFCSNVKRKYFLTFLYAKLKVVYFIQIPKRFHKIIFALSEVTS